MIDAHQHFWNYTDNSEHYVWMSDEHAILKHDYEPSRLYDEMKKCGVEGTVAVQAREMNIETDYLLELSNQYPFIMGVVGWLDMCDPAVENDIAKYAEYEKLKGLRMVVHDQPDVNFAKSARHKRGVALLKKHNLTYDLLLKPPHIKPAQELVDENPNQKFVIDHIAKPEISQKKMEPWFQDLKEIAQRENVSIKLSGLVTEGNWEAWRSEDFKPYLDQVLDCFGPNRLMIGSDWPVCNLVAEYCDVMNIVKKWTEKLSSSEQELILSENCKSIYNL